MFGSLVHHTAARILSFRLKAIDAFRRHPQAVQERVMRELLQRGLNTQYGHEFDFYQIRSYTQFQKQVPVRTYEEFYPHIDQVLRGQQGVLWSAPTRWFAKSSGTTNDRSKFIPVPSASLNGNHYRAGRDLLATYLYNYPDSRMLAGKSLSLGGSLTSVPNNPGAQAGDISAVIIRNLPWFYEGRRAPSMQTALLPDWDTKVEAIAQEVQQADVRALAGVPTWAVVLLKRLLELTNSRSIHDFWPAFEVFFHGAVSFAPYRRQFERFAGSRGMRFVETYNASEGFFAFQDQRDSSELLLLLDHEIFYEFVPLGELGHPNPQAIPLWEVELDTPYAVVITTAGGLWRYLLGDTVRFTSKEPYRLLITGRTKHFINAFGEEVVVENADQAIEAAARATNALVSDYTAGPIYFNTSSAEGLTAHQAGGHEWLIEFAQHPSDLNEFVQVLDATLQHVNTDYEAKRRGNLALGLPTVRVVERGTFEAWLRSKGKVGGQHKVPRLSNDRTYLEAISSFSHAVP
jgi:hypothetical protein